ncbi:heterokaryon incompatibility protein 6, OR allele [Aspergillus lentulus]|nr:heterokaryon incompatibility protein 6, OR allele [Aspergillus lentulus]
MAFYQPLDPSKQEIRLLRLDGNEDQLSGQLIHVCLKDKCPSFVALSYVWGHGFAPEPILLNGHDKIVTANLMAVLRYLTKQLPRLPSRPYLWIDALCINQDDNEEKGHQVGLMKDIYMSAHRVCSWLGESPRIFLAFRLLRILIEESHSAGTNANAFYSMNWLSRHQELLIQEGDTEPDHLIPNPHWKALRDLVDLPYWSRMWIFQEIVLSGKNRLTFFSSMAQLSEKDLYQAIKALRSLADNIHQQEKPDFVYEHTWLYLKRLPLLANSLKNIQGPLVAKALLAKSQPAHRPALCILSAYGYEKGAKDPRDYYYSLLGAAQMTLQPDYSPGKSVQDVCIDFVQSFIEATQGTDHVLSFLDDAVGLSEMDCCINLPSWAPGYHLSMMGRVRGMDHAADAAKGISGLSNPIGPKVHERSLFVSGVQIDRVFSVDEVPSLSFRRSGAMRAYLVNYAARHGVNYVNHIPLATALYATITQRLRGVSDSWAVNMLRHLQTTPVQYDDSLSTTWADVLACAIGAAGRGSSEDQDPAGAGVPTRHLIEALVTSETVCTHRLFQTIDGYIGLAPVSLVGDDVLCVLDGFIYPVILREGKACHYFVGPCFVLGLMEGETPGLLEEGRTGVERFEIK